MRSRALPHDAGPLAGLKYPAASDSPPFLDPTFTPWKLVMAHLEILADLDSAGVWRPGGDPRYRWLFLRYGATIPV